MSESTEEQKRKVQLARQLQINDLKSVLSRKEGRRFVWRFLKDAGIFHQQFNETTRMYWQAGIRSYALRYFNDIIEHCNDLYIVMSSENRAAEELDDATRKSPEETE